MLALNLSLRPWRRVPLLLQSSLAECGAKCLAMVAGYYGTYGEALGSQTERWAQSGATLSQIASCAADLGLLARALRLEPQGLSQLQCPAILHWDLNHFVVLVRCRGSRAVIHDPARGRINLSMAELAKHFTGVALELQPGPNFSKRGTAPRLRLRDLLAGAQGFGLSFGRIIVLSLLVQLLLLASPLYLQWVVDEALHSADWDLLAVLALAFGLLLIIQVGVQYLRDWLVISIGNALALRMASGVADHLLTLPLRWFEVRRTGDVFARYRALAPITGFLSQGLPVVLVDGTMAVLALAMLALYEVQLSALVLCSTLLYAALRSVTFQYYRRRTMSQVEAQAWQESQFLETLRGIPTVKAFGQESARFERWQQALVGELNAGIGLARFGLGYEAAQGLIFGLELLLVVYLGAQSVLDSTLSLGMLFAFLSYRSHFIRHISAFITQWLDFRTLGVNLERLADICLSEPETAIPTAEVQVGQARSMGMQGPTDFSAWRGDLQCRDISVSAPGHGQPLLSGLDLQIESGELVALVGESGCGKTSLLQCLMGLQPVADGQLWVGQMPLSPHDLPAYRRCLGVVQQQDKLFAGSIFENITLFAPPSERAQKLVAELLALVGLAPLIQALPMGMATNLGELGTGLSGGQAQRVVLARALYRQPKALFLDEVTANLDPQSAGFIQRLLVGLPMTRVVVTHDPAFAAQADHAYQMCHGGLQLIGGKAVKASEV